MEPWVPKSTGSLMRLEEICRAGSVQDFINLCNEINGNSEKERVNYQLQSRIETVPHLLCSRFDTHNNVTPLILCCKHGHSQLVKALLTNGAAKTINYSERHCATAYMTAAGYGHILCIRELTKFRQLDVSKQDERGRTAVDWAAYNGHFECLIVVLKQDHSIPFLAILLALRKGRLLSFCLLCVVVYIRCLFFILQWGLSHVKLFVNILIAYPWQCIAQGLRWLVVGGLEYTTQRRKSMHIDAH